MKRVVFGKNSKSIASKKNRLLIQRFYRDVLGCTVKSFENADRIEIGPHFQTTVIYEEKQLREPDLLKSIWLELECDDPLTLKQSILDFGVAEIVYWDKKHFYFQAPGGQVFRLVQKT